MLSSAAPGGTAAFFPYRRSVVGRRGRLFPLLPQVPHSLTMACTLRARLAGATTAAAVALSLLVALTAAPSAVSAAPDELVFPAYPIGPPCPPYTLCSGPDDCPPWRGIPRRCAGIGGCTSSACGVNKKTCRTSICTADCRFDVGTCQFSVAGRPSTLPASTKQLWPPPRHHCWSGRYQLCESSASCGHGRFCLKRLCTPSRCVLEPRTCRLKACTKDCLRNRGYCAPVRLYT